MNHKWYGSVGKTFVGKLVLALVIASGFTELVAHAQEKKLSNQARLDAPVTQANSILVDFGDGAFLRVPKFLIDPTLLPKDTKQPLKLETISMVFQFPDMVETVYPSPMALIFEKQAGRYERKPDRFPVHVKWLFHSHQLFGVDSAMEYASKGPEWRPVTLLGMLAASIRASARIHHVADDKLTYSDAKYKGLREIHIPVTDPEYKERSEKEWRKYGWDGKREVWYVERTGSPFELYMRCDPVDSPNSSKCEADVYIKRNHFQYHITFPPEAVAHADELIRTINKMINSWIQK